MTLIDNHHIEEFRFEQFFVVLGAFFTYQLLIEGEIYLVSGIGMLLILLIINLMDGIGEGLEILFDRLINQDIAVCQIKHLLHQFRFQEAIDDLEGSVSLTRTCGHHQQHPLVATSHRIHRPVHGITLIIAGRKDVLTCAIGLVDNFQFVGSDTLSCIAFMEESGIKLILRGKCIHRERTFLTCQEVIFLKTKTI